MTDDDMFEHMDTILGDKSATFGLDANKVVKKSSSADSKPSAIWNLVDKFGMTIEISAKDLKLWGVKDE